MYHYTRIFRTSMIHMFHSELDSITGGGSSACVGPRFFPRDWGALYFPFHSPWMPLVNSSSIHLIRCLDLPASLLLDDSITQQTGASPKIRTELSQAIWEVQTYPPVLKHGLLENPLHFGIRRYFSHWNLHFRVSGAAFDDAGGYIRSPSPSVPPSAPGTSASDRLWSTNIPKHSANVSRAWLWWQLWSNIQCMRRVFIVFWPHHLRIQRRRWSVPAKSGSIWINSFEAGIPTKSKGGSVQSMGIHLQNHE